MITEWVLIHKVVLQWVSFGLLIFVTALQFLLNMAYQRQTDLAHTEMQKSINVVVDKLEQLSKVEGLDRYLQDIKIESLRKYVAKKDLEELQKHLQSFSVGFKENNIEHLREDVHNILKIIPTDPYFRVVNLLLQKRLLQEFLDKKLKIVQVVRWDWIVEGKEAAKLYVLTADENGNQITYGPLTNNTISMLDSPISKFIKIGVEGSGTGRFEWHPRTFRIGWAIAEQKQDGLWEPIPGLAEYDPYFRIGLDGNLEF